MLRIAFRGVRARAWRLAITVVAVVLGVAFTAGTFVLTDTISKTFDQLFTDAYEGTDAVVRRPVAFAALDDGPAQRGRVDASLVDIVERVEGVEFAEGTVEGYTQIVGADGEPLGDPEMGDPTLGGNWSSDELNPFTLVEGRPPERDDEVVVDRRSADIGRLRVGDTTTVLVQGPPQRVKIAGIATFAGADSPGGASYALFTRTAAQRLIAEPGRFDAIWVVADAGVSQEEVTHRIAEAVPDGIEVITGEALSQESKDDVHEDLSYFRTFMLIFAVIALLVGSFMIYNTFSITVAQRSREIALLRAVGASRRQVRRCVFAEAVLIGLIGSIAGLAAGIGVAVGLKALLGAFGFAISTGSIVVNGRTVVVAMIVGVVVTVVAAVAPARKAARLAPVEALREAGVDGASQTSRRRVVLSIGLLGLGSASLFTGLFGGSGGALQLVGLGVLLIFLGVFGLNRTLARPLSGLLGAPLPLLRGVPGELARANAMRNPKRTAATASALMIGVGLIGFITILASSTRASVYDAIDDAFTGDFVVVPGVSGAGGLDPTLAARLADVPSVEAATAVRTGAASLDGTTQELAAFDPDTAFEFINVQPLTGSLADLDEDGIAVFRDVADENRLAVGDRIPVVFTDTGHRELTVAVIYAEDQMAGDYFIGIDTYEANFAHQLDSQVLIETTDGVTAETRAAIEQITGTHPGAKVLDEAGFKADQTRFLGRMLGLIYALLGLAILIAILGITNTLALSVLDRTRELGLLRAVGTTRAQLRTTVRWESVLVAVQGALLGLVIGVLLGWAIVTALHDEGISRLDIPVVQLAVVVALAGLAGVVAAVVPARRAAKLDILDAIVKL